jgi:hypothetical protein
MKQIRYILHQDVAEIFFPVEKIPCAELFQGFDFVKGKDHAIFLATQNKIVHFCSDNYQLVSNRELISPILEDLEEVYGLASIRPQSLSIDDRKFYTSLKIQDQEELIVRNDRIHPSIEIRNSYDGSMKFSLSMGFWRTQTLTPLMGFALSIAEEKKHSNKYHGELDRKNLKDLTNFFLAEAEKFRQMARYPLTLGDISRITERVRKKTEYPKRLINDGALEMYREAQAQQSEPNLWLLYNGFNQVFYHADIQMHWEFRERIGRQLVKVLIREIGKE